MQPDAVSRRDGDSPSCVSGLYSCTLLHQLARTTTSEDYGAENAPTSFGLKMQAFFNCQLFYSIDSN